MKLGEPRISTGFLTNYCKGKLTLKKKLVYSKYTFLLNLFSTRTQAISFLFAYLFDFFFVQSFKLQIIKNVFHMLQIWLSWPLDHRMAYRMSQNRF